MSENRPRTLINASNSKAENDRQYRNIDVRITAHSILRDRFAFRSLALKVLLFVASILLCGFTFSDDKTYATLGIKPDFGKVIVGLTSLIIAALSVTELIVKWDQRATLHEQAAKHVSNLKRKYRIAYAKFQGNDIATNEKLSREWDKVHETLPEIPEKDFVAVKAKHASKIQLSQFSDANRDIPHYLLIATFNWRAWQKLFKGQIRAIPERPIPDSRPSLESGSSESK